MDKKNCQVKAEAKDILAGVEGNDSAYQTDNPTLIRMIYLGKSGKNVTVKFVEKQNMGSSEY